MATPYNFPSGTTNDISFGPARVFMTTHSTSSPCTPNISTDDVGYIGEDGVTIEMTAERRDITQGNPRLIEYSFTQAQSVMINFTSIAWDATNMVAALGGIGVTTISATEETFGFGGDPINKEVAMHIRHEMAVSGNTLHVYAWRCMSESGFSMPFGQDEHQFEYSFKVLRAEKFWDATTDLPKKEQLIRVYRDISS